MMKRYSLSEKLGIRSAGPLTIAKCREKVKKLQSGLKRGRYKGQLKDKAEGYLRWYRWYAGTLKKSA